MLYSIQLQLILALSLAEIVGTALRLKRTPEEKFRTLLRLYRMNPLKLSSVYERLTDRLMLTNKQSEAKNDGAMNLDSNESTREKQRNLKVKLKHIEKVIHAKPISVVAKEDTAYNVTNVETENFNSERFLHRHNSPHSSVDLNEYFAKISPNVDFLFGHIGGDSEEDNRVILTKIRPANRTVSDKLVLNITKGETNISDDVVLFRTVPRIANFVQYNMIGNISDIEAMVLD